MLMPSNYGSLLVPRVIYGWNFTCANYILYVLILFCYIYALSLIIEIITTVFILANVTGENVALDKPSWVSDLFSNKLRLAEYMNDGRLSVGHPLHDQCITAIGEYGWWKVDLLNWYVINEVTIYSIESYGRYIDKYN